VLSSVGPHQVPPQPPQFAWLELHHPDAQLPLQLPDHLQQEGAGAGVGAAVVGVGGGAGVGAGAGVGTGAGVGDAGPVTLKSKQEMKVSGGAPQATRLVPPAARYSCCEKASVFFPTLLKSLQLLPTFQSHRPTAL